MSCFCFRGGGRDKRSAIAHWGTLVQATVKVARQQRREACFEDCKTERVAQLEREKAVGGPPITDQAVDEEKLQSITTDDSVSFAKAQLLKRMAQKKAAAAAAAVAAPVAAPEGHQTEASASTCVAVEGGNSDGARLFGAATSSAEAKGAADGVVATSQEDNRAIPVVETSDVELAIASSPTEGGPTDVTPFQQAVREPREDHTSCDGAVRSRRNSRQRWRQLQRDCEQLANTPLQLPTVVAPIWRFRGFSLSSAPLEDGTGVLAQEAGPGVPLPSLPLADVAPESTHPSTSPSGDEKKKVKQKKKKKKKKKEESPEVAAEVAENVEQRGASAGSCSAGVTEEASSGCTRPSAPGASDTAEAPSGGLSAVGSKEEAPAGGGLVPPGHTEDALERDVGSPHSQAMEGGPKRSPRPAGTGAPAPSTRAMPLTAPGSALEDAERSKVEKSSKRLSSSSQMAADLLRAVEGPLPPPGGLRGCEATPREIPEDAARSRMLKILGEESNKLQRTQEVVQAPELSDEETESDDDCAGLRGAFATPGQEADAEDAAAPAPSEAEVASGGASSSSGPGTPDSSAEERTNQWQAHGEPSAGNGKARDQCGISSSGAGAGSTARGDDNVSVGAGSTARGDDNVSAGAGSISWEACSHDGIGASGAAMSSAVGRVGDVPSSRGVAAGDAAEGLSRDECVAQEEARLMAEHRRLAVLQSAKGIRVEQEMVERASPQLERLNMRQEDGMSPEPGADHAQIEARKQEQQAAARRSEEEEQAAARKREDQERVEEEQAAARKLQEEEQAARRVEEEAAAARRVEEEQAAARKLQEEQAAARRVEEEQAAARKLQEEEEEAARRVEEEQAAAPARRVEEEAAAARRVEEEQAVARKLQEEQAAALPATPPDGQRSSGRREEEAAKQAAGVGLAASGVSGKVGTGNMAKQLGGEKRLAQAVRRGTGGTGVSGKVGTGNMWAAQQRAEGGRGCGQAVRRGTGGTGVMRGHWQHGAQQRAEVEEEAAKQAVRRGTGGTSVSGKVGTGNMAAQQRAEEEEAAKQAVRRGTGGTGVSGKVGTGNMAAQQRAEEEEAAKQAVRRGTGGTGGSSAAAPGKVVKKFQFGGGAPGPKVVVERITANDATLDKVELIGSAVYQMKAEETTAALAQGLAANTHLRELHLVTCGISDQGAAALGHALATNRSLVVLNLEGNKIKSEGGIALAAGLAKNRTLQSLSLLNQQQKAFGDACLTAFMEMFEENVTLLKISWRLDSRKSFALNKLMTRNNEIDRRLKSNMPFEDLLPDGAKGQSAELSAGAKPQPPMVMAH
ncbi:hypothetical protein CYMTET_22127 [Cymbomonas tetramitiformis]|uniref:Uncharacterized protein n=1 Tax=Cymbomonas tetramitiformis TaxID=36881 RepID=A0AAE0G1G6_9CHLO|nr:hypothetical protein CYMTET_22127 [Cymbomonas tetramitiformis]